MQDIILSYEGHCKCLCFFVTRAHFVILCRCIVWTCKMESTPGEKRVPLWELLLHPETDTPAGSTRTGGARAPSKIILH